MHFLLLNLIIIYDIVKLIGKHMLFGLIQNVYTLLAIYFKILNRGYRLQGCQYFNR